MGTPADHSSAIRHPEPSLTALATGQAWTLDANEAAEPVRIGRDPDIEVPLPFKTVSRVHAIVERANARWFIRDADSVNGTAVNAEPVGTDRYPLRDGDQIVVGGVITLVFNDPTTPANVPTTARTVGVWIDPKTGVAWVDGGPVDPPLSTRQRLLLALLYRHEGDRVKLPAVVKEIWPGMDPKRTDAVHELAERLAQRLRPHTTGADYLEITKGQNLRLRAPGR